ncbi:hypothetical protein GC207_08995 [bacterium]|nr:hypothetical protein [bacterium]
MRGFLVCSRLTGKRNSALLRQSQSPLDSALFVWVLRVKTVSRRNTMPSLSTFDVTRRRRTRNADELHDMRVTNTLDPGNGLTVESHLRQV